MSLGNAGILDPIVGLQNLVATNPSTVMAFHGNADEATSAWFDVAAFDYDPREFTDPSGLIRNLIFSAWIEVTASTGRVRIFNKTTGLPVTGSELSSSSATGEKKSSLNINGSFSNARHDFVVQMKLDTVTGLGDRVICKMAKLDVRWT